MIFNIVSKLIFAQYKPMEISSIEFVVVQLKILNIRILYLAAFPTGYVQNCYALLDYFFFFVQISMAFIFCIVTIFLSVSENKRRLLYSIFWRKFFQKKILSLALRDWCHDFYPHRYTILAYCRFYHLLSFIANLCYNS